MEKVLDFSNKRLLYAADIHGNGRDFLKIVNMYRKMKEKGLVDLLIFGGDLVHGYGTEQEDNSVQIIDTMMKNSQHMFSLLGNHELVHIYHITLFKRMSGTESLAFTDRFENAIANQRDKYVSFIKSMPTLVRTHGGVLLSHVGANGPLGGKMKSSYQGIAERVAPYRIMNLLDHDRILEEISIRTGVDHRHMFDGTIGDVFSETPIGSYLWHAYMDKEELHYEQEYQQMLDQFLMSMGQNLLVTGHIETPLGYQYVGTKQLRLGSSHGAQEKKILYIDSSKKYNTLDELAAGLVPLE